MARLSLRARVTLAFVAATAVVLGALGVYLHQRLASELDASITAGLRQRGGDVAALAADATATPRLGHNSLVEPGDDVAQILASDGSVVATAPGLPPQPLLSAEELGRARHGPVDIAHRALPREHDAVRLLAIPAGDRVAIVGASVENRDEALASLDQLLLLGLPAALLIASAAGYLAAGRALRPVTTLSERAEALGAADLSERMPVPPARDEVRRLAESLNAMLARLADAFARERAFVADASHELRTPLARLKAELELAGAAGRTEPDLRAAVASATDETDHLVTLANDLLVLARADQARLPLRTRPLAVAPLLGEVAARAGADISVGCPDGLRVQADPVRVTQALTNLVDNARRHGRPPIVLNAVADGSDVVIHVRDHGDGIDPALRPHVFDRFTRGDAARESDGAGLGLALVAAIAEAHGGSVGIGDSTSGADVWLRLSCPPAR